MTQRMTATEASRHFSELLNRVKYNQETVIVTRGDELIAEIRPIAPASAAPDVAGLIALLQRIRLPDPDFASDLEAAQAAQGEPPRDPWAS